MTRGDGNAEKEELKEERRILEAVDAGVDGSR
jgi:hypothetical protein